MATALPEVCTLSPESLRRRTEDLRHKLLPRIVRSKTGEHGFSFALPLDEASVADAEAFVDYERQCCGFARFECRVEESETLVWVDVTTGASHRGALADMAEMLRAEAPKRDSSRPWLTLGGWGVLTGVLGLACCATPMVAVAAATLGLSAALFSGLSDLSYGLILVTSLVVVAYGVVKRRGSSEPRCGCSG